MENYKFWFVFEKENNYDKLISWPECGTFQTNSDFFSDILIGHITLNETTEYKVSHQNLKFMEKLNNGNEVFLLFENCNVYQICNYKNDSGEKVGRRSVILYKLKKVS